MLSNKLTFSLTSLVLMCAFALAFLATPAIAQRVGDLVLPAAIENKMFGVVGRSTTPANLGIVGVTPLDGSTMPDLAELLLNGGTIELQMGFDTPANAKAAADGAAPGADADAMKKSMWQKAVISEVMWGRDEPPASGENVNARQWIEIYNNTGADTAATAAADVVALRLVYFRGVSTNTPSTPIYTAPGPSPTADTDLWVLVDRVSTINRFGNRWASVPGQSGNTVADPSPAATPVSQLKSMYRKINLEAGNYKLKDGNLEGLGDGREMGSWAQSEGRINMSGPYVGSPDNIHVTAGGVAVSFTKTPASFAHKGVIINEVRNDTSEANLDWIELFYSTDDSTATSVNVADWELSIVTSSSADDSLAVLPRYKMKPGDYLVVYNRHPGKSVTLAGGVNLQDVIDKKQVDRGASHMYVVAEGLDLPSDKQFLILLRNGKDKKKTHEKLVDYAGNGFFSLSVTNESDTDVWPFIAWTKPGDVAEFGTTATFGSQNMSWGRKAVLNSLGEYSAKSRENRVHHEDWQTFDFMGAGYDRGRDKVVDTRTSPGTPGYPNVSVNVLEDDRDTAAGTDDYVFSGKVSISEIMYDAGPRWNLVQWIELYNSSSTETVDLKGWEMEIRNEATDIESYVDSSFEFDDETMIPPNQTLLLISSTGTNDVPPNYIYNLAQNERKELGLQTRGRRLLSNVGFHIELRAKHNVGGEEKIMMVDRVGNVEVKGAARNHMWDLLMGDDAVDGRQSIVRKYGSSAIDGSPDEPSDGLMASSWALSDLTGASLTFYGHRDDISTPGFRLGGPLPVTLSKFRPVRNQTTGHVDITWITQSELNNAGFNILRSEKKAGEFKVINVKGIIAGHGTTSEKHVYTFTDTTAKPNVVYYYQIEDVSINGQRTTLTTTHLRGNVSAGGKLTTRWGELKSSVK